MRNHSIRLDEKLEYYIYGAGTLGKLVGDSLAREGFQIQGYIDQRAGELHKLNNISVYGLDILPKAQGERGNNRSICVAVAVKDVFEHEKIKQLLLEKGINKIIYKPQSVLDGKGTEKEKEISSIYDSMVGYTLQQNTLLPLTEEIRNTQRKKWWILNETGDMLTTYVPCELIYTNYDETGTYVWGNLCIYGLFPHIGLFRFFAGNGQYDEKEYLEFCIHSAVTQGIETTDRWKKNVLRNRNHVFRQMFYYWSIDREFFVRNAPKAKWNHAGMFHLTSGKHRAAFQAAMGQHWIPLQISKDDYQAWVNRAEYIEHPLLMEPRNEQYVFWRDILAVLEYYVCKLSLDENHRPKYRGQSFFSNCSSEGFLERNLRKFGLEVTSGQDIRVAEKAGNQIMSDNGTSPGMIWEDIYDFGLTDGRNSSRQMPKIRYEFRIVAGEETKSKYKDAGWIYQNYYGDILIRIALIERDMCQQSCGLEKA